MRVGLAHLLVPKYTLVQRTLARSETGACAGLKLLFVGVYRLPVTPLAVTPC